MYQAKNIDYRLLYIFPLGTTFINSRRILRIVLISTTHRNIWFGKFPEYSGYRKHFDTIGITKCRFSGNGTASIPDCNAKRWL